MSKIEREWAPPGDGTGTPGVVLYNSLVDAKVPFVPSKGPDAREISWYTCGPTVYDSAHMGHARNYVTGDILRRVLEDYFGYECFLVMNVTDVDDKIIKRARTNHLMTAYKEKHGADGQRVLADCKAAVDAALTSQEAAEREATRAAEECAADSAAGRPGADRRLEGLRNNADEQRLKLEQLQRAKAELDALSPAAPDVAQDALRCGGDSLAARLDKEHGHSVTDPGIFRQHAARYEDEFLQDMDRLGVRRPDCMPRVSEYVPEIVAYIQKIVDEGMAYEANGSVYFSTAAFRERGHTYGKLDPWAVGSSLLSAEGEADFATGEKRRPTDFALWKAARPGEPTWPSPWGPGRPGWHIECSAMASELIGQTLDVHSGGSDLRFPHHDNELAQSEAHFSSCGCRQWVNYFLHSGRLNIDGLKMSKSLKNFITIRDALEVFTPRQLRLMFVLQAWDKPMVYGEGSLAEMRAKEAMLKNFFQNVEAALRAHSTSLPAKWLAEETTLHAALQASQVEVRARLRDNIDTPGAMAALERLVRATNVYLSQRDGAEGAPPAQGMLLRRCAAFVTRILGCFGLAEGAADRLGFEAAQAGDTRAFDALMDAFATFRDDVRGIARTLGSVAGELLAQCDRVRDETLVDLGVRLEDRPKGGAVWKRDDPAALRAEIDEKRRAIHEAKMRKVQLAIERKRRELDKYKNIAALPTPVQALAGKYRFDETGNPTHDAAGATLDDKGVKAARKALDKESKIRAPLAKVLDKEGDGYLDRLAEEIVDLEEELKDIMAASESTAE
ncbi:unnamed protein product [Pedinophyceae sp. YPF-701]|nr:unnamed protein product [Pedinophyceae sp. YPF-701]